VRVSAAMHAAAVKCLVMAVFNSFRNAAHPGEPNEAAYRRPRGVPRAA